MAATASEEGSSSMVENSSWTAVSVTPSSNNAPPNNAPPNTAHLDFLPMYDRSLVRVGRKIAEGGQGKIYEAKLYLPYSLMPVSVVVKKFKPLEGVSQGQFPYGMNGVRSYNLCIPFGVFFHGNTLCMIMQRYSCDLRAAIDSRVRALRDEVDGRDASPFGESGEWLIIHQLATAMRSLHELGIYHRDLKAANILVKSYGNNYDHLSSQPVHVAISDFERSDGVVGTGFFRAPEVLRSLRTRVLLSAEEWLLADVYSFGMVCYEVLTGRYPFEGHPLSDYDLVLNGGRPELPEHMPELWRSLISRCWHADPHSRPTWDDIIKVVYLKGLLCRSSWDDSSILMSGLDPTIGPQTVMEYLDDLAIPETLSFESLVRESKQLVRHLTALHESDSESFRSEFMPHHWASRVVATAEEYASQFEVGPIVASKEEYEFRLMFGGDLSEFLFRECGVEEAIGRMNLFGLLRHQVNGAALMLTLRNWEMFDQLIIDVSENMEFRERLLFRLYAIGRIASEDLLRMLPDMDFEAGTSWTRKMGFYHDLAKYVIWCEHADAISNRDFLMKRLFPARWSVENVMEGILVFICMMGNAYFYVLAMMTWEPLLLGLQGGLYKIMGSNSVLYRSSGERICRFQRAWVNCTRYEVVPVILTASLVAFLAVCGWKGIFSWILVPCVIICSPYWRRPVMTGSHHTKIYVPQINLV